MNRIATLSLALAFVVAAGHVSDVSAQAVHNTGSVTLEVFSNGMLGQKLGVGAGFTFGGTNGLFEGQLMFGTSANRVSGSVYATDPATPSEDWLSASAPVAFTPPAPYDQGFEASFLDFAAPNPYNITVTQRTFSAGEPPNNDFVVVEYTIDNTSGVAINGAHVGFFADYDVNAATANLGGFDADTRLLYVFDTVAPTTHYGTILFGGYPLSGWDLDTGEGVNPTDVAIWTSMTTFDTVPTTPDDRRTLLATGPYDIAAGAELVVRFGLVAGSDLDDIRANALAALNVVPVAASDSPATRGFELMPAAPNPTAGRTALRVSLDESTDIRLSLYDVLGREVAQLLNGPLAAGTHPVTLDVSALPAGTYVARLSSGNDVQTQMVTVLR